MLISLLPSLLLSLAPQQPALPGMPQLPQLPAIAVGNASNVLRFVDFHQELDRPGLLAVVGQLDKWKEGRRERLRQGTPLGGLGARIETGGTQYFKVAVKTAVTARAVFAGSGKGRIEFDCDLQLARLANGDDRWQSTTPGACAVEPGMLALFVLAPPQPGKRNALLHVIPFDARLDLGASPQDRFVDTMHDFVAINRRVHDLEAGIAKVAAAAHDAAKGTAKQELAALLAQPVDLHQPEQRTLLLAQASPFELRARELLGASVAVPANQAPPGGDPGGEPHREPGK